MRSCWSLGYAKRLRCPAGSLERLNHYEKMKATTKRTILRTIHILFALPLIGYIYGPPEETVQYLSYFRYGYFPVVVISGLLMWKGHLLGRLISNKKGEQDSGGNG